MNHLRTLCILGFAALMAACSQNKPASPNAYVLNGTANGIAEGTEVFLVKGRGDIDTAYVKDGKYSFEGVADSVRMATVRIKEPRYGVQLFLEPGTITLDYPSPDAVGTKLNDDLAEWSKAVEATADQDSMTQITLDYYHKFKNSQVGEFLFQYLAQLLDYETFKAEMETAPANIRNDSYFMQALKQKEIASHSGEGNMFIEIKGPKVNCHHHHEHSLSKIIAKGKPVLVDFTASWCGPCKNELKTYLIPYYEQYKDKVNFVSIDVWDENMDDMLAVAEDLGITWDIIFNQKEAAEAYGVQGVPTILLIDASGKIVARDIRGEKIEEAIKATL